MKRYKPIGHPIYIMARKPVYDECCPPACCDMRGLLSFQILWELGKKPMNGQELAKRIAVRRGSKPTPGTIYPALKDLFSRNLIEKTLEGRQVIYKLTIVGRKGLLEACRYFYRAFGDIFEDCKCDTTVRLRETGSM